MQDKIPVKYPDTISNEELYKKKQVLISSRCGIRSKWSCNYDRDNDDSFRLLFCSNISVVFCRRPRCCKLLSVLSSLEPLGQFQSSLKRASLAKIGLSNTGGVYVFIYIINLRLEWDGLNLLGQLCASFIF